MKILDLIGVKEYIILKYLYKKPSLSFVILDIQYYTKYNS